MPDGREVGCIGSDVSGPMLNPSKVSRPSVTEPVWWGARLRVSRGARYTEVAGHPIVTVADPFGPDAVDAPRVIVVDEATVAVAIRLDGRPLDQVFADERASWTPPHLRRLLDLARRCKALGIFEDIGHGDAWRVDWATPPTPTPTVTVWGRIEPPTEVVQGPEVGTVAPVVRLSDRGSPDDGAHAIVLSLAAGAGAGVVPGLLECCWTGSPARPNPGLSAPRVVALGALIASLEAPDAWRDPSVIECCAHLAESVPVRLVGLGHEADRCGGTHRAGVALSPDGVDLGRDRG